MQMQIKSFRVPLKNGFLDCVLEEPPSSAQTHLVIIMHGRKSSKGREGYLDIGRIAHENGYRTLRFDFRGHGDSYDSPNWERYGVLDQLDDLKRVLSYLDEKTFTDGKIMLIPSSFSSEAALLCMAQNENIEMSILISPGLGKNSSGANDNRYRGNWWNTAIETVQIPFDEYKKKLSKLHNPVFALHGTEDVSVPIEQSEELQELIGRNFKLFPIEDGMHKYTQPKKGMKERQNIIRSILSSKKTL